MPDRFGTPAPWERVNMDKAEWLEVLAETARRVKDTSAALDRVHMGGEQPPSGKTVADLQREWELADRDYRAIHEDHKVADRIQRELRLSRKSRD